MNRSPLASMGNSCRLLDSKVSNTSPKNGFIGYGGQRSRHQNSVKYSNSMNLSTRLKAKSSKNSKSKKKNNSYYKVHENRHGKNSNSRSPNTHQQSISSKVGNLSNSHFNNSVIQGHVKRKNSTGLRKNSELIQQHKNRSRERTNLSQERINKRENGKQQIVKFIGKYIKKNNEIEIDSYYDETLKNLKDFLGYLEDKNIINGQQLEDKKEVNNLIKDLMKLDLSKFNHLKKSGEIGKKKKNSRNINVSVNRSNSVNPKSHNSSQNYDSTGRKVQSVSSKNIYKVVGSHNNQSSEDFMSSRRLSYVPDDSQPVSYQALGSVVQNKNYEPVSANGSTPNQFKMRTPVADKLVNHSKRYETNYKGKTTPSSLHHSKEREPGSEHNHIMIRQKFNSHSNANILKYSNPNPPTLENDMPSDQPRSGNIGVAPDLPKRSGSQKVRGNSQHFLKRKDGVSAVESQQKDIAEVLKQNFASERRNDSHSRKEEVKQQNPAVPVKQNPPTPESENGCPVIETGVDKVTFNVKIKDDILSEREKMIKGIKVYIRKNKRLPPTTLEYYKFVKLVGKGAFGKVTLGVHKLTGKQVAIKTIEKAYMKDDFSRKKVLQEVYILKNIKHSNVIRLLEVFESPKHLLIVMEYSGGGDLLKYIKKYGRLEENKAREIFIQTVHGLAHCH